MFQTTLKRPGFLSTFFGNSFDLDKFKPFADEVEHKNAPFCGGGERTKYAIFT